MSQMSKVGDGEFEAEVLQSDKLTVVDFGAEWCGPCKKLHPIMEEIAGEMAETVKVVEVDIGVSPQTGAQFGITSVPQIMFFKDGEMKERIIGMLSKSQIIEKIDSHLG